MSEKILSISYASQWLTKMHTLALFFRIDKSANSFTNISLSAFSRRVVWEKFCCFPCKPVYELITGIEWTNQDVRNALSEVENLVITDTDDAYSRFIFQKSRICQLAYNSRLHKK